MKTTSKLKKWMALFLGSPKVNVDVPVLDRDELSFIVKFAQEAHASGVECSPELLDQLQGLLRTLHQSKGAIVPPAANGATPSTPAPVSKPLNEAKNSKKELHFARIVKQLLLFLETHYHLRYNVLTRTTELGDAVNTELVYHPITDRDINSICLEAQMEGINCWDMDVKRCIHSNHIADFHPVKEFLMNLPKWDGVDRVSSLAQRVSHDALWTNGFRIWMRGMVAQWMHWKAGDDRQTHGHALAPILISTEQGWGKSTFCKMLLPKELNNYYSDSFDVLKSNACEKQMATNVLINMDEFDSVAASSYTLPKLKNLMQKTDLRYKVGNAKQYTESPRLASFIGTTNRRDVMTDTSGNRRFLCVEVEAPTDCVSPIDYQQLYAQVKSELERGLPYWMNKEEEKLVNKNNRRFHRVTVAEEVFFQVFRFADSSEEGAIQLPASMIFMELKKRYASALRGMECNAFAKLLAIHQAAVHTKYANLYTVVRIA